MEKFGTSWRSSVFSVNLIVGLILLGITIPSSLAFPSKQGAQHSTSEKRQTQTVQISENIPPQQHSEKQARVRTITVMCHPDFMEIVVKADMFEVGTRINGEELRLGVDYSVSCRATPSSGDEYKLVVGLSDCGTKHWMTDESLIYTNLLIYSPMDSPDGLIRMDEAVIPIECHYGRKYSLSSSSLMPTWVPYTSTQSAVETLDFKLKVMTSDWLYERGSKVFFIGEPINIEASVRVGHHTRFRVFVSSCVATLDPDSDSVPRYAFIEADGCLVDSQLQGSDAHFLPRTQDNKLQFTIDAFKFHEEDRAELYITCHLTAVPVTNHAEPQNKACTFINGRWRSADTSDYLCSFCPGQNGVDHVAMPVDSKQTVAGGYGAVGPRGFGKTGVSDNFSSRMTTNTVWEQDTGVGPMLVLPPRYRSGPLPLDEIPPLITQISRPMYGSQWRTGIGMKMGPVPLDETNDILESDEDEDSEQERLVSEKERGLVPVPTTAPGADVLTPEAPRLPGNRSRQDEDDSKELEGDVATSDDKTKDAHVPNGAGPSDKTEVLTTAAPSTVSPVSTTPEDHTKEEKDTSTTAPATDSDKANPKK